MNIWGIVALILLSLGVFIILISLVSIGINIF